MDNKQPGNRTDDAISCSLYQNYERLDKAFANCSDIIITRYRFGPRFEYESIAVYCESLIDSHKVNFLQTVLQDLSERENKPIEAVNIEEVKLFFSRQGVSTRPAVVWTHFPETVHAVLNGEVVIFLDSWEFALGFPAYAVETRQVGEPINEPVVRGPHDSTVESITKNIGVLRSRLRDSQFKIQTITTQGQTKSVVAYGYMDGNVNPETLAEFKRRIVQVQDLNILETSYVEELIEDSTYSPFPQYRYTERPDVAISALLDGKIIVLVSGTPSILICPGLFVEFLSTSEDYYERTVYSTLVRTIRFAAFFMALTLPSLYIAFSTYHPELIPTVLLLAILDTREGIPFPAYLEALIMEFFFEIMREAGIRLPRPVGSAVSIVGALVIGQAAIQAKIASPIMVIVVALTGIASFSMPQYNLGITVRILRFPLMIFAATLGVFGLMIGYLLILLHLTALRSLGQPYLSAYAPLHPGQLRDVLIRAPLKYLLRSSRVRRMGGGRR
ncbi:spore germination protein [Paenibacillus sp. NPDC056579]|uniref:spore germination protein n=1 Tax=unclassified Paenibacillus TaxID=185978 RepID=UPI001EF829AB|nr:spore germination protein [Paenibacillus sp. H1-7]ULL15059.1 spore germination protein [Paenibacillus sp. H1-7]